MADNSHIQWTDSTWNCLVGCTRISAGCGTATEGGCYAERMSHRFGTKADTPQYHGVTKLGKHGPMWTGKVNFVERRLYEPLKWKKPRKIFVASMSDPFHENVQTEWLDRILAVMLLTPQHTYQVLTKRPERMRAYLSDPELYARVLFRADQIRLMWPETYQVGVSNPALFPAKWIWWGTSVENQATADERLPHLVATPAKVRFVSYEPAIGPVDFTPWLQIAWQCSGCRNYFPMPWRKVCPTCGREDYWTGSHAFNTRERQVGPGLSLVIVGGESGPRARGFDLAWAKSTIAQCRNNGTLCFVKQVGARPYQSVSEATNGMGGIGLALRDRSGGDLAEWPHEVAVRELPA